MLTLSSPTTNFQVEVVNPTTISPELSLPITELARKSFGTHMSQQDVWSHVVDVDLTVLLWQGSQVKGFLSANIYSEILFIHGVVIDHNLKGLGLSKKLLSKALESAVTCYTALTTQNPRMYQLLASFSKVVYPSPTHGIPEGLLPTLKKVVTHEFATDGVLKTYYPTCLYSSIPTAKSQEIDDWFLSSLDANSQRRTTRNAFVFVGRR